LAALATDISLTRHAGGVTRIREIFSGSEQGVDTPTVEAVCDVADGWDRSDSRAAMDKRRTDTFFAFKAIAPGQVMLTFAIRQPDRQDGDPRGTFKVRVNVQ
jgi:hypothetical protein